MVLDNKKGQVTLFIVMAIIILGGIIAYTVIRSKASDTKLQYKSSENPAEYIAGCVENIAKDKIPPILEQGGYKEPALKIKSNGTSIAFLCFTALTYSPCINQEPLYIQHLSEEIKESISEEVEGCFEAMKKDYEEKNIDASLGNTENIEVELLNRKVLVTINKEVSLSDRGATRKISEFKASINSPTYNLARVAMEIVAGEASFCYSEYIGYQTLYPWVKITKQEINSDVKIYRIIDKATSQRLNIAVRSCAIPAGF